MDSTSLTFYTYIYLDPRKPGRYEYGDYAFDFEPFYVGKGKDGQLQTHLKYAINNTCHEKNKYKYYKIKNILKENLEPEILKIEDKLSEQDSFILEIYFIWAIGRSDLKLGPLTNHTDGGEGCSGRIWTDEQKRKVSLSNKGKRLGISGYRWSEEEKKLLSKKQKGKVVSYETKLKMSKSAKLKIITDKHKENIRKSNIGKPATTGMCGKKHSAETKLKMSEKAKGRNVSKETKLKISNTNRGRKAWNKGKEFSTKSKLKMSLSHKGMKYNKSKTI